MLRFFPTVRSEFSDVFSSLRLRKLLSWKHPLDAMEYIVTPVIFRSSRIAEELAASAESRGISNPGKHTCRRKIEFTKKRLDYVRGCCLRNRTLFCAGKDGSIMVNDKARRSVIQFKDVSFEYPGAETDSIHHISLDVKEGEFLVLTGGSGCGKTTLTRLINGLAEQFYEGTAERASHTAGTQHIGISSV